jgi:hypothetical protein
VARGKALTIRLTVEPSTNVIDARLGGNVMSFSRLLRLRHCAGIAPGASIKDTKVGDAESSLKAEGKKLEV